MPVTTVPVGGIELPVAVAGEGGRPILLVHGFCGAKEDFTDWLPGLAGAGWHAVAYDQRGHGLEGRQPGEGPFSLQGFADDVFAVADALGWPRFVLLGHSMGGMAAQLAALSAPERLAGLILMDTCHGPPEGLDPALLELGRAIVRDGGLAALVEVQRGMAPGPLESAPHQRVCQERPAYAEFCERKTIAASPEMWLAMTHELFDQADRLQALAQLTMPVLVTVGEDDRGFLGQSRNIAAVIPGCRLAEIAGGGHSPQFEAPEAWWYAVSSFLAEVRM